MPELRGSAIDKASLLNLGTYTAGGLPLQFPDTVTTDAEMVKYFEQWEPDAVPSAQRRYSNPSIGLFGRVTARAMNGGFADVVEAELFPKLGLRHTYIRVPEAEMGRYAWGYTSDNKPVRVNPGVFDAEAYGVKSTAADMIRFVEANIRTERLARPMRRAVEGTHIGYFKIGEMVQGLGWEQFGYPITLERLLAGNSTHDDVPAQPGDAHHTAVGSFAADTVQQDRFNRRVRSLRGLRTEEEDRHRDAREQELPDPGARHGGV